MIEALATFAHTTATDIKVAIVAAIVMSAIALVLAVAIARSKT
jgi:hypothetical protein